MLDQRVMGISCYIVINTNETFNTGIHVSCKGDNPRGIPSVPARTRRSTERYTSLAQWWLDQASGSCPRGGASLPWLSCLALWTSKNLFINLPLYVDDRYFASKKGNYSLVIGAQVTILNSYIQDTASVSGKTFLTSLTLSPGPVVETTTPNAPIPWYLYVIPAIVGLVFIIIIGCILYFCGFLRRKRLIPHRKQINHSLHAVYLSPHLAQQDNLLPAHQDSPLHSHAQPEGPKLEKHLHRKMTCPKKLMMMHTSQKSDQSRTDQQTKYKLPIVRTEPFYK
eukprot:Em0004g103a